MSCLVFGQKPCFMMYFIVNNLKRPYRIPNIQCLGVGCKRRVVYETIPTPKRAEFVGPNPMFVASMLGYVSMIWSRNPVSYHIIREWRIHAKGTCDVILLRLSAVCHILVLRILRRHSECATRRKGEHILRICQ